MDSPKAGYNLVSADSHVIEPADLFEKRLPAGLRDRAPKVVSLEIGDAWSVAGAEPVGFPESATTGSGYRNRSKSTPQPVTFADLLPALSDPAERIRAQEADSVDAEVIYPYAPLWDAVKWLDDPELQLGCVRAYNDWIAEFSAHSPDRLLGLGKIPSTSPADARAELVRCVEDLKLRGVILDAWPGGALGEFANDPFWDTVSDAGVPVSVHYGLGTETDSLPISGVSGGERPPMADVALPLVTSGLFDRLPNLRLVLAHGNAGWALHWLEFMDMMYIRRRHLKEYTLPNPEMLPSQYVRQHFWFTFNHDRTAVAARNLLGGTQLLWASHFPLDTADWPDDRQRAVEMTNELPEADQRALLAENAARLYRLPGYQTGFSPTPVEAMETLVHF